MTTEAAWRAVELAGRGTTLACDQPGPGRHAPAVVLLHGWAATGSLNWAATIAALSERYRVIALDHRGHGGGIRTDDPFRLEDCADDVVALLDVLGVEAAIVAGYSMGGPIAQLVWRRHRDRVRGLVLCATAADFTTGPDRWLAVRVLEEMKRRRGVIPRRVRGSVARPLVGGLVSDREVRADVLEALASHHERLLYEAGQAVCRFDSLSWIGSVDVPTVVVVTTGDQVVRPASQHQLADAIGAVSRIEIAGTHLAAITQPYLVAGAMRQACDAVAAELHGDRARAAAISSIRRWLERRRVRRRGRRSMTGIAPPG